MPYSREIRVIISAYGVRKTIVFSNHGIAEITCRARYFDDACSISMER